jgi:hypothetical protein
MKHVVRVLLPAIVLASLVAIAGGRWVSVGAIRERDDLSVCRRVVPACPIRTLPAVTLTKTHPTEGALALRPYERDVSIPLIDSDEALAIAWDEDAQPSASSRVAVLGLADPGVSWGPEHPVVYAVRWFDVCVPLLGPGSDGSPVPTCRVAEWDTIIDAITGEFVVAGS